MDRRFAIVLSVVFAVFTAACDAESSAEPAQTTADRTATQSADSEATATHRTRTGLAFETPGDWSTNMMPAGAKLLPPDGPSAEDSYLLVIRFAPDGIEDATDTDYLDRLASGFTDRISEARIADRETGLDSQMGPASYVAWDVRDDQQTKRVGFFVAIDDPWMLVLRATGPKSRIEDRHETVQSIFASAELTDADTDPKLAGTWRRLEPIQTDNGPFRQVLTFEEDGTLRLSHEPDRKVSQPPIEDLGRWATAGDRLIQYVGNSLEGGVQVKNHNWTIDGEGLLQLEGEATTSTWKPVE